MLLKDIRRFGIPTIGGFLTPVPEALWVELLTAVRIELHTVNTKLVGPHEGLPPLAALVPVEALHRRPPAIACAAKRI